MKVLRNLFRLFVGIVFIFSGFVKGVDPLGTVYRIQDYFLAFGTTWANDAALGLTIFLCTLEFILGISLLFNIGLKYTSWILLPVMTFFTILTFFDATYNMVPDCGCFGDAVKLSNTGTFIKNLILMGFVVPVFIWRKKYKNCCGTLAGVSLLFLFAVLFSGLSVYALWHLPPLDFRDWKVGNKVNDNLDESVRFYVTYKNRHTGETQEFLAPNYPWNDSTWLSNWIFVSQRVEDPNEDVMSLLIEDREGNNIAKSILSIPDVHFLVVSYDLKKADTEAIRELEMLYRKASAEGYSFIALTSSLSKVYDSLSAKEELEMPFYNSDDIVLKSMIRANPGLIMLRDGVVVDKWHYNDLPDWEEIASKIQEGS